MSTATERLWVAMVAVDGVVVAPSAFSPIPACWVGGRDIAHLEGDVLDLRLTMAEIRVRRPKLRLDGRVALRPSSSADWLDVTVADDDAAAFALDLFRVAVAAHLA